MGSENEGLWEGSGGGREASKCGEGLLWCDVVLLRERTACEMLGRFVGSEIDSTEW